MFASQHTGSTEFNPFYVHVTQYTRPNLPWSYLYSVTSNDHSFLGFDIP